MPSGATLRVRAGTYTTFSIADKSLHIAGEGSGTSFPVVRLVNGAATIAIGPLSHLQVTGNGSVVFAPGTAGLEADRQSRIVLVDSSVTGGPGSASFGATAGGPGILLHGGSILHACANAASGVGVTGGPGGRGISQTGAGGAGIVLQGGATARVAGLPLLGGTGTPNGQAFVRDATSTLVYDPNDVAPSGSLVGIVQPNDTVHYTLRGRPASATVLTLGFSPRFQMLPILALGCVGVNALVTVGPFVVPAHGVVDVPSLVPGSWPNETALFAQLLVYDPAVAELRASNTFTATSRF